VAFDHVSKVFTLEIERPRSFKEAFVRRRRRGEEAETLTALDDVSFSVERGTSFGLVGPNGTGKSTALKLVAGILEPTAGEVHVSGRVAALLELGAGFHPELSGRDNVYLDGSLMGLDRADMSVRLGRIADFAELGRFMDVPVKHYSSGMFMRLGFATAVHLEPDILLVDEVLAVGDQSFQAKCRDRIARLQRGGVSIVLVSHDLEATRELCERAVWLESGIARAIGPTHEVVESYYLSVVAHEEERLDHEAADPTLSARWGSGEVRITACDVLDASGRAESIVVTGSPAAIRLRYEAARRVERPVFGLAIHRQDGVHVTGPNTRDAGLEIEWVEGAGEVRFEIPEWPLLEGTYLLSASVYDSALAEPFDYHHRRFPIHVRAGHAGQRYGLLHLAGTWMHQGT
jgi:lipopolysaccharide transport system ATP-binding protein